MTYAELKKDIVKLLDQEPDPSIYQNLQDIEMLISEFFEEADEE